MSPEVVAVVGPTATGKTIVGAAVAKALGSEVISVDSQLIYSELSIGVARPTEAEMQGVPHHLIGFVSPEVDFSAGDYVEAASPLMHGLRAQGKSPVFVGGTGFYLRALLQPRHIPDVPVSPALRAEYKALAEDHGNQALYERLHRQDPNRAAQLHPNDRVRVMRALEIVELTGRPVPQTQIHPAYPTRAYGLTYANREAHVSKIRRRLEEMITAGFLEEVETVYARYGACPALKKAHGYPELLAVLQGKRTLEDALDQIEINIRQYSKRQMTWFRQFPNILWFYVDETPLDEIVTNIGQRAN